MGIKITGVNLGYLGLDHELLVFPHPDFILTSQRKEAHKHWYQCPVISYIIDHPDGRILFETGISTRWEKEWLPEWQFLIDVTGITPDRCLEARLQQLGLGLDDFRYLVLGHLHCDHAGGLRLFQGAGATIVVHEDEHKHVMSMQSDAENFFVKEDWAFLNGVKPMTVSGDGVELVSGVKLYSLPGHTPGTMGMMLDLDHTGKVLLTSDALYTHQSYGPPAAGSPIVFDSGKWAASVEKIRTLAMENDAFVFPGHDETGIKHHAGETRFEEIKFTSGYQYE